MAMDLAFIRRQYTRLPYPEQSFVNQTIIVTGSNTGLGLEAARHFVRLGASKVILACRSISKGEEAAVSIAQTTNRAVCEVWHLDMGDFDTVKAFAKRAAKLDRLDVAVLNAGIATAKYSQIAGMESTIAVNVVGTFLLALNLLPILRKSGKEHGFLPRLVITSSERHGASTLEERHEDSIFETLKKNEKRYMADRYHTSKLLEVFPVRSIAAQMSSGPHAAEKVVLNTVNPGFCHSGLAREVTGFLRVVVWVVKALLARTTEVGSRNLVFAASAGEESHGQYFSDCAVAEPSPFVMSEEGKKTQDRVHKELMAILEEIQPGITQNI